MFFQKTIFFVSLSIICGQSVATTYYVSSSAGNDLTGSGKKENNAWRTISRINRNKFFPGDSILFKCGDTWRESLILKSSGAPENYIYFGSYGSGEKPKILGSEKAITWKLYSGNVWTSGTTFDNPYADGAMGSEIFFVEKNGSVKWGNTKEVSISGCSSVYDWNWSSKHIYTYSPVNPDSKYRAIEVPQRAWGIDLNDKECITIDGFEVQFCLHGGIGGGSYPTPDKSNLIIKNNSISYCGIKNGDNFGISAVYSNMIIKNNIVHDIGRRGISIYGYGKGRFVTHDILIEGNTMYNGFHTTGVDISCGSGAFGQSFEGIIIRNNLIYDNPKASVSEPEGGASELINIESYYSPIVRIKNLYIYCNILKYPSNNAVHIYGIDGAYIYNNTFYGHNELKQDNTFHISVTKGCKNVKIKNNIFYIPMTGEGSRGVAIQTTASQDYKEMDVDYNLYYRINPSFRIIETKENTYNLNDIKLIRTHLNWEIHGLTVFPEFKSDSDYHLKSVSQAIGKGIKIDSVQKDFDRNYYRNPPSLGALEGNLKD